MNYSFKKLFVLIKKYFLNHIKNITADTLGWMAAVCLHLSTVPSILAYMSGLSAQPPNVDLVLFIYTSLILLFGRAILLRDYLNIITIGIGFIGQSALMAFILFR